MVVAVQFRPKGALCLNPKAVWCFLFEDYATILTQANRLKRKVVKKSFQKLVKCKTRADGTKAVTGLKGALKASSAYPRDFGRQAARVAGELRAVFFLQT